VAFVRTSIMNEILLASAIHQLDSATYLDAHTLCVKIVTDFTGSTQYFLNIMPEDLRNILPGENGEKLYKKGFEALSL